MKKPSFWLSIILLIVLSALQYRYWFGDGGVTHRSELAKQIRIQSKENERLSARNHMMAAEVMELKQGMETVEERARHELGMIKQGETLYLLME